MSCGAVNLKSAVRSINRGLAMPETTSILLELDDAIVKGSAESRERALWHATNLLIAGRYSDNEIWIFGEVIGRLAEEIEVVARARLAKQLAHTKNAPTNVIKRLAFDDSIAVAGPVLRHSERLDSETLIAGIRRKGEFHHLAISKRTALAESVTDELVTRGSKQVVNSVATNTGAQFSNFGFLHMLRRSENDSILAENLGMRRDIPRRVFQQLISRASEDVKRKLENERPDLALQIQESVTDLAGTLHSKFGPASKDYFHAKRTMASQYRCGNLNEKSILQYALSHKIENVAAGLSLLCSLPAELVERTLLDNNSELTLVLAKALDFSWETAMSLLFLTAKEHRISTGHLNSMKDRFARLNVEASRAVLRSYRSRKAEPTAEPDLQRLHHLHS
jgi:uncharacterized protein (DUF2336 family)